MTIGSHQTTIGKSQNHITPRWLIDRLGPFDLDPAAADPRPWACAKTNWTEHGLALVTNWRWPDHDAITSLSNRSHDYFERQRWHSRQAV